MKLQFKQFQELYSKSKLFSNLENTTFNCFQGFPAPVSTLNRISEIGMWIAQNKTPWGNCYIGHLVHFSDIFSTSLPCSWCYRGTEGRSKQERPCECFLYNYRKVMSVSGNKLLKVRPSGSCFQHNAELDHSCMNSHTLKSPPEFGRKSRLGRDSFLCIWKPQGAAWYNNRLIHGCRQTTLSSTAGKWRLHRWDTESPEGEVHLLKEGDQSVTLSKTSQHRRLGCCPSSHRPASKTTISGQARLWH